MVNCRCNRERCPALSRGQNEGARSGSIEVRHRGFRGQFVDVALERERNDEPSVSDNERHPLNYCTLPVPAQAPCGDPAQAKIHCTLRSRGDAPPRTGPFHRGREVRQVIRKSTTSNLRAVITSSVSYMVQVSQYLRYFHITMPYSARYVTTSRKRGANAIPP
ncbi:hypothetical protein VTK26DRAFT_6874 [Humicola hyalothermophila]